MAPPPPATVVFFHPDLGIGGAERLVVDAAVGLQARGHRVVIFTNHCDADHCFDECRDGTLDVRVRAASPIPPSLFSRFAILCAILRHIQLILHITLSQELAALRPSAFVVDQLSAGLPLLRLLHPSSPILFYCHFPDLLLATGRRSLFKSLYRLPFDWLEEWSMTFAQAVALNSRFTRSVVERTWPRLRTKVCLEVVYPCVDVTANRRPPSPKPAAGESASSSSRRRPMASKPRHGLVLSINRFERKKDIGLAIKAYAAIPEKERHRSLLVVAGGYDDRVLENVQYHIELGLLASSLHLSHRTLTGSELPADADAAFAAAQAPVKADLLFLLSIPTVLKADLLRSARLLLYTPANEHFGIVPLEAMLAHLPVLAANTGGPVETILHSETGWLCDPADLPSWTSFIRRSLSMPLSDLETMGAIGAARVESNFGRDQMLDRFEAILSQLFGSQSDSGPFFLRPRQLLVFLLLSVVTVALIGVLARRQGTS